MNGNAERTVVTAGDANYVWGVWLLLGSMRRWNMTEKIIVGAHNWPREWLDFLGSWPKVRIIELSPDDKRCTAMSKPLLMLDSETDYVTWVDSDGIFRGNCSGLLHGADDELYSRSYLEPEHQKSYARMPETIRTWLRDVGDLPERRDIPDVCTNVVGVSLSHSAGLLRKWIEQIRKVLPDDVGIVSRRNTPYFQTDESVLNSLLSCWSKAPKVTENYRLNNPASNMYIHLAYNPKPWQTLWTPYCLKYYDDVISLVEWMRSNGLAPAFAPLPPTLRAENRTLFKLLAPLAPYCFKLKKLRKRLLRLLSFR